MAHQAPGSSSSLPSPGGTRHPVSALKKWLTSPARKLSFDRGGVGGGGGGGGGGLGKNDKLTSRLDGKTPERALNQVQDGPLVQGPDGPRVQGPEGPLERSGSHTILPYTGVDTVRTTDTQMANHVSSSPLPEVLRGSDGRHLQRTKCQALTIARLTRSLHATKRRIRRYTMLSTMLPPVLGCDGLSLFQRVQVWSGGLLGSGAGQRLTQPGTPPAGPCLSPPS